MSLIVNATAATCPSFDAHSLRWGTATDGAPLVYGGLMLGSLDSPTSCALLLVQGRMGGHQISDWVTAVQPALW